MRHIRKTYPLQRGRVIDIEEYHAGNYGAPGIKRKKKTKPTKEQMRLVNAFNKTRRCRHRLLKYIEPGDIFATLTYEQRNRPPDMKAALKDFQKAMKTIRREYQKRGRPLYWFRNIERGTKGAWHIHLVISEAGGTADILQRAWEKGGVWFTQIRKSKFYDEDFTKLANYMTKNEHTPYLKADGTPGKPRIREAKYNTSRNMPLPEPDKQILCRWEKEPRQRAGYYIARVHEGKNPVTGFKYRRYTLISLKREDEESGRKKKQIRGTPVRGSGQHGAKGKHAVRGVHTGIRAKGRDRPREKIIHEDGGDV